MKEISQCCLPVTFLFVLIDFLFQNAMIVMFFIYYNSQEVSFVNSEANRAFKSFLYIYLAATFTPKLILITCTRAFSNYDRSRCFKFLQFLWLIFTCAISADYFWVVFGYSF